MGFSRQDNWSGMPCPLPTDLPNPEIEPTSAFISCIAGCFFTADPPEAHHLKVSYHKMKVKSESESCSVVSNSLQSHGLYSLWNSPGQNTGVGSLSLLQGVFPTQGLNPGLLHCRWILYQLSHIDAILLTL